MSTAWIERASDNFNRANEDPLSGGGVWSNISPLAGMRIVSNQLLSPAALSPPFYGSYHHGFAFPPNQYSKFTHGVSGLMDIHSRAVRCNPGLAGMYAYIGQMDLGTPTTYYIETYTNGTLQNSTTFLGRPSRQTFPIQRVIAVGTRIAMEYWTGSAWVEHSFITDNLIPTGFPGIVSYRASVTNYPIDDWSGGDDGVPGLYTGPDQVPATATGEFFGLNHSVYYWGAGATFNVLFPAKTIPIYMGQYDANAGGSYASKLAENIQYEILSSTQIRLSFHCEYKANSTWNHGVQFSTGIGGTGNLSAAWDVPLGETRTYYRTAYFQILVNVNVNELGLPSDRNRRHRGGELWSIVPEIAPYLG
jgi:hypothetical protein